jgi:hypothetical protein
VNIEPIKLWIDRQLNGTVPRVLDDPHKDKVQVVESDLGLVAICKAGCFLVDELGNAQQCDLETDGTA